jgi:hypothetical protein
MAQWHCRRGSVPHSLAHLQLVVHAYLNDGALGTGSWRAETASEHVMAKLSLPRRLAV